MISNLLTIAGANFILVGFKAFQQRNVTLGHYKAVLPISFMMAISDVLIITLIATLGFTWWNVAAMAIGGGFGCLLSMKLHERIFKNGNKETVLPEVQSNVGREPCDTFTADYKGRLVPSASTCLDGPTSKGVCLYPPSDYDVST